MLRGHSQLGIRRTPLIFEPAHTTPRQLARSVVVGGIAFLVDFGTLYALTAGLHIYYLISAALAFILGLTCNYALSRVWVFDQRTMLNTTLEYVIFAVIGLIGLGLNQVGMWVLTEQLHLHYLLTKIGTTAPVFLWNFCARKYLLFR